MTESVTELGEREGAINNPNLSPSLKIRRRALKDAKQAWGLVKALRHENSRRNSVNSRIMSRYNSEAPYRRADLENLGLDWKSNFSTKPLATMVDKVAPRFTTAIKGMKYLTASSLPDSVPGAAVKTEAFRDEITKLCRSHDGWNDLLAEIAQENSLFGFTSVSWSDEFSWMPRHFAQKDFFVPQGTGHYASSAQVYVTFEQYLIHELFELIEDKEAAETAGWNIENTIKALNEATPSDIGRDWQDTERIYQEMARELTLGVSHGAGSKTVDVYTVYVSEADGKVSQYIITAREGEELFSSEDRFDSMSDVVSFFSFQHGDGKLHGSKGIGRDLYTIAGQVDKMRNEVIDRLNLAGKILYTAPESELKRFRMTVVGNSMLVGNQFQVQRTPVDKSVEPFLQADAFLTNIMDQISGATSPKALEGERVTKAAVELFASRDEERRDVVIDRFVSQFAKMISTLQRRAVAEDVEDEAAKEMQKRLLDIMSREELDMLAGQPAAETVADYSDLERQSILLAAQEGRGNPLYNQRELEKRKLSVQVSSDFAESVLLPVEDPTELNEQTRLQQMENLLLTQGVSVPISPRDNHLIHLQELESVIIATADALVNGPEQLPVFEALVVHARQHFDFAVQSGIPKPELAPIQQKVEGWEQALIGYVENEQALQAGAAPPETGTTGATPVPVA